MTNTDKHTSHPTASNTDIPGTLDECFVALKQKFLPKELQTFFDTEEDVLLGKYHFSWGLWLRNAWGLQKGSRLTHYFQQMGINESDDMSSIILKSFWRHLHEQPLDLENQILYYQDYWAQIAEYLKDTYGIEDVHDSEALKKVIEAHGGTIAIPTPVPRKGKP